MTHLRPTARGVAIAVTLTSFGLCGNGPVPKGSELSGRFGAGTRSYQIGGGCAGTVVQHQATELSGAVGMSHRFESDFSVSTQASAARSQDRAASGGERQNLAVGKLDLLGGYQGRYAGLELGPSVLILGDGSEAEAIPFVAGNAWVGVPDAIYFWGDALSAPVSMIGFPLGVGLGHQSDRFRVEAGVKPGNLDGREACPALDLSASYRIDKLWFGAGANACDQETYRGALSLAYVFGATD